MTTSYNVGRKIPLEEHPAIAERVQLGETLRAVADDYGCTRERIRQIAAAVSIIPELRQQAANVLLRERAVVLTEVRGVQWALRNGPCRVCTGPVTRHSRPNDRGRATCGLRCCELWKLTRIHLDEQQHQALERSQARSTLEHSTDPVRRRWAERVLAGTTKRRGRWFQKGSNVPALLQEVADRRAAVQATGDPWWV